MIKESYTPEEIVDLAKRAPRLLAIVEAMRTLLVAAVDVVYDRVTERLAIDQPVTFVYMGGFKTDREAYAGGERGTATWEGKLPCELIDLVLCAPAAQFDVVGFYNGDESLLAGAGAVPADVFFPTVWSRYIRTHKLDPKKPITIQFVNREKDDPTPERFMAAGKFRSQFKPDDFAPTPSDRRREEPDRAADEAHHNEKEE